jgi:hypothetical protein
MNYQYYSVRFINPGLHICWFNARIILTPPLEKKMTTISRPDFVPFLLRAKRATYAGGDAAQATSSRPQSHDLAYREGRFYYLDTYLGGFYFAGEEAVWEEYHPIWSMNYYGTMIEESLAGGIPEGFGDFLKLCLRQVQPEAPYRGPTSFARDGLAYTCRWAGSLACFQGEESISLDGQAIYRLFFHGGRVK